MMKNHDEIYDDTYEAILFKIQCSRNVLRAQKSSLVLRDTTDYRSKFMVSPASHCSWSYAHKGLRKGGFPLPFANMWMHVHMRMRLSMQRAGLLNGYSIEF